MENESLKLKIAGLHTLSFFGYVLHMVIHNLMSHGMAPAMLAEMTAMMKKPSMQIMFVVWNLFTLAPAFFCWIAGTRKSWKVAAVIGLLSLILNTLHSFAHIAQGDYFNGINTVLMQVPPALIAVVWNFKLLKTFDTK